MKCKIAVIMSVYHNDKLEFVNLAVDSILKQTYTHFDLYIQYDGIIKEDVDTYLSTLKDPRMHIFRRHQNKGLAYSLNELLDIILTKDYEFIARMDADDISMENRFERQINYLKMNPHIDCIGSWAIEITSNGVPYFHKQMPVQHDECKKMFRKRDCLIHPTVMFRKSYFEKAGLYSLDTYFGEDTMMWAQGFANNCKFGNIPEYLLKFRLDDHFFQRRRGWKHAKSIFLLRYKVNRMLQFGITAYFWAMAYALIKLMPTPILNIIYRKLR